MNLDQASFALVVKGAAMEASPGLETTGHMQHMAASPPINLIAMPYIICHSHIPMGVKNVN